MGMQRPSPENRLRAFAITETKCCWLCDIPETRMTLPVNKPVAPVNGLSTAKLIRAVEPLPVR
jgi:hypothetical protein